MAVTFNTNVSALTAQRYLGAAGDAAASSLSKLSSGSRVPTAKDDAAGLAIGTKLKAEVAGLQQAGNNAAQAISLLQIADGALSTVSDVLQRMKSLSVQASSGQLSNSDRGLLNQEFQNLKSEVDRIANTTNFNGTKLLQGGGNGEVLYGELKNGGMANAGLSLSVDQSVAVSGDTFRVSYDAVDGGTAYDGTSATTIATTTADDHYNLTVTNLRTGETQTIDMKEILAAAKGNRDPGANLAAGAQVDVSFASMGVTVRVNENFDLSTDIAVPAAAVATNGTAQTLGAASVAWGQTNFTKDTMDAIKALTATNYNAATGSLILTVDSSAGNATTLNAVDGLKFSLNGGTVGANNAASGDFENGATNIVSVYATNGYDADGDGNGDTDVKLFDLTIAATTSSGASGAADGNYTVDLGQITSQTFETGANLTSFDFKVGTGTTVDDSISFDLTAVRTSDLGISTSNIATAAAADAAIGAINTAIGTVASRRADVGAAQSRLQFASDSIAVAIENTSSAQSALMDVDVSAEITTFTSKQVLLQAGVSLLAQANQQPALLLRLLQ